MTHCTDGAILAVRDGALVDADDRLHLEACGVCSEALEEAERRSVWIERTLAETAIPVDTEAAKRAVRARLDGIRAAERPRRRRIPLGQAAAMVLLGAVAASALPNSPVRSWFEDRGAVATTEATTEVPIDPASESIEVPVSDQGLVVVLRGVPEGEQIEVVWTDGATARISAADGSAFSFAEGRAEAVVTGGPIRLLLPRTAGPLRVDVNGRRLLSRRADELELPEGSIVETPGRVVLQVPQY